MWQALGDIAVMGENAKLARECYRKALRRLESFADNLSLGAVRLKLARVATPGRRSGHLKAASLAWSRIGRQDLLAQLRQEFPSWASGALPTS
jgi:hypothetical protein